MTEPTKKITSSAAATRETSPEASRDISPSHGDALRAPASRPSPAGRPSALELPIAGVLFAIALVNFLIVANRVGRGVPLVPALAVFVLLAGAYLGLSVSRVRLRLARAWSGGAGVLVPPGVLVAAIGAYMILGRASAAPASVYAAYLLLPVVVAWRGTRSPAPSLLAAAILWLPLELRLLPPIPLPPVAGGYDASHLVALVNGLCLFLVTRPMGGVGFTFLLRRSDAVRAVLAFALFALVALPIGLATHFLAWNPRVHTASLAGVPWLIYLGTAVPEEFLFRGVIQNACTRAVGPGAGLAIASVVFGLAHLPDWRYALLAAFAGVAYGWVYAKTGKITASAVTHALVDWVWVLLLRVA